MIPGPVAIVWRTHGLAMDDDLSFDCGLLLLDSSLRDLNLPGMARYLDLAKLRHKGNGTLPMDTIDQLSQSGCLLCADRGNQCAVQHLAEWALTRHSPLSLGM